MFKKRKLKSVNTLNLLYYLDKKKQVSLAIK